MPDLPDENQLGRYFSMIGKKGAKARNERLSPERRKEIATKASKAAAKARTARKAARARWAKQKKAKP
jgi:hypothetical protein